MFCFFQVRWGFAPVDVGVGWGAGDDFAELAPTTHEEGKEENYEKKAHHWTQISQRDADNSTVSGLLTTIASKPPGKQ